MARELCPLQVHKCHEATSLTQRSTGRKIYTLFLLPLVLPFIIFILMQHIEPLQTFELPDTKDLQVNCEYAKLNAKSHDCQVTNVHGN